MSERFRTLLMPMLAEALTRHGVEPLTKGRCTQVIDLFETQEQGLWGCSDPEDLHALAAAYDEAGRRDMAVVCWRRYVELFPEDSMGYFNLGYDLTRNKKEFVEEGRQALERAIEFDPTNIVIRHEMVLNCSIRGDVGGEIENLRFIIANSDPEDEHDLILVEEARFHLDRISSIAGDAQ